MFVMPSVTGTCGTESILCGHLIRWFSLWGAVQHWLLCKEVWEKHPLSIIIALITAHPIDYKNNNQTQPQLIFHPVADICCALKE
jgi:hypothetical protein